MASYEHTAFVYGPFGDYELGWDGVIRYSRLQDLLRAKAALIGVTVGPISLLVGKVDDNSVPLDISTTVPTGQGANIYFYAKPIAGACGARV